MVSSKRRIDEISPPRNKIFGGGKRENPQQPDSRFSTRLDGTMKYAEFMARVECMAKPASRKDLFFPPLHAAAGS
jgi:hypothetical protein